MHSGAGAWRYPRATAGLNVVGLVGATMVEVQKGSRRCPRAAPLSIPRCIPMERGTYFSPAKGFELVAEKANRPIIVAAEPLVALGSIGGPVIVPGLIGAEAANLALRILHGEPASSIPVTTSQAVKPIFNWLHMQRWGISESDLPPGSEVRFREPQHMGEIPLADPFCGRRVADAGRVDFDPAARTAQARQRGARIPQSPGRAGACEPSGDRRGVDFLDRARAESAARRYFDQYRDGRTNINSPSPDLSEVKDILADIRRDDIRAGEILHHMRSFPEERRLRTRLSTSMIPYARYSISSWPRRPLEMSHCTSSRLENRFQVRGDQVQLQQVIMNLVVNSMDAMAALPNGRAVVGRAEMNGGASAVISILDSGTGIPVEKLNEVFIHSSPPRGKEWELASRSRTQSYRRIRDVSGRKIKRKAARCSVFLCR